MKYLIYAYPTLKEKIKILFGKKFGLELEVDNDRPDGMIMYKLNVKL